MASESNILRFEAYELDRLNRQLRHRGAAIEIGSRYFDALALLAARSGELVTKDEFMDAVWHGIPVTDEALTQCIRTLRRVLNDDAANPRFIETVPKHGYRFIAPGPEQQASAVHGRSSPVAGACTLAGMLAGVLAGLFYGVVAGTGSGGQVLILALMVGALGLLAGAGLGAGMAAAIAWRGRVDLWIVAGAALGGLSVGALGNLLGREGVGLISGVMIGDVTGPFEGVILGTATGLTAWAATARMSVRTVIATAILAGTGAGALIRLSGGTLLAGSLQTLQQGLPGIQLDVAEIGALMGAEGFTQTARTLSAILESQVFTLAIVSGFVVVRERLGPVSRQGSKSVVCNRGSRAA